MSKHPYSADRPHETENGALPGRNEFARNLAVDIQSWNGDDCLVMALYGEWGSGKSSLKNLLKAHLIKGGKPLTIMEFNPWQYSGKADLTSKFFEELSEAYKTGISDTKKSDRMSAILLLYAAGLYGLGMIGKASAAKLAFDGQLALATAINYLSDSPVQAANMMKVKSDQLTKEEKDAAVSHEGRKKLLIKYFKTLTSPLLVVIDDIDRLAEDEIIEIMQLVKSNADFPKVIFLLLCERSIISSALDKISGGKGNQFLEKIVQVFYHVPHATRKAINSELFIGLDSIIVHNKTSQKFSIDRWRDVFNGGLEYYFNNLRHVRRFLGSFNFHFRHFLNDGYLEVNTVDLIALETFRVFEPSLYERLPGMKKVLTRQSDRLLFKAVDQDVVNAAVSQLLLNVPEERRDWAKHVLYTTFPTIAARYNQEGEVSRNKYAWLGDARACHDALFDKYFTLVVPEEDLSSVELFNLIDATSDHKKFLASCSAIDQRHLLETAISRLDAVREKIPVENLAEMISGLFDLPIPDKSPRFFDFEDLSSTTYRLVYFGLLRTNENARFAILNDCIKKSSNPYLPVQIVGAEISRRQRKSTDHEYLVNETQLGELKALCLEKIDQSIAQGDFAHHPRLTNIFGYWIDWVPEIAKSWLLENLSTPEMCVQALRFVASTSTSESGVTRYNIRLSSLESIVPVALIEAKLKKFDKKIVNQPARDIVNAFRAALTRREEGEADTDNFPHNTNED